MLFDSALVADLKIPWVSSLPLCSLPGVQRCCMHSSATQCSEKRLFGKIHTPAALNPQRLNRGTALFDLERIVLAVERSNWKNVGGRCRTEIKGRIFDLPNFRRG